MDFSLSPDLKDLRARVRALVDDVLQPLELEAEQSHGRLSPESHARVKQAVLDSGLNAANIPTEYGGGGLNLTHDRAVYWEGCWLRSDYNSCIGLSCRGCEFPPGEAGQMGVSLPAVKVPANAEPELS